MLTIDGQLRTGPLFGDKLCLCHRLVENECKNDLRSFHCTDLACVFNNLLGQFRIWRKGNLRIGPGQNRAFVDAYFVIARAFIRVLDIVEQVAVDFLNYAAEHGIVKVPGQRDLLEFLAGFAEHQSGLRRHAPAEPREDNHRRSGFHAGVSRADRDIITSAFLHVSAGNSQEWNSR